MDFKKALIASSAIVAVGGLGMATADAAKKPKLKISGYYELFAGIADGDRTGQTVDGTPVYQGDNYNEEGTFAIVHYGEIRFKVKGKTDSGMKWGVYFEDVQDDSDSDGGGEKLSTDETNLWLSGSWGKLLIGGQDGASDQNYRGAEKLAHINPNMLDLYADTQSSEGGRGFAREKMSISDSGDASKITYYTPRISGFQAGYSWAPHDEKGSEGGQTSNNPQHEGSVEYKGKVAGGKLRATWGFGYMPTTACSTEAQFGWRAGVTYGMGPWTIAAGYKDIDNEGEHGEDGDKTGWDAGVAYSGGRYEIALIVQGQEAEDSGGDGDYIHYGITGAYNLGGGLTFSAAVYFYDLDDGGAFLDDPGDTNGTVGIVAVGAKF